MTGGYRGLKDVTGGDWGLKGVIGAYRGLQMVTGAKRGFRTINSTVTALIKAADSWSLNIERNLVNAVVLLDLRKAFDTVNHVILSKLQAYGIHDSAKQFLVLV